MSRISFTVPGPPVPKGRPRVTSRGTFTPARTRAYEKHVKACAMAARGLAVEQWPTEKRVAVFIRLYVNNRRRTDVDNLAKSATDPLIGVLYRDDSQIDSMNVRRAFTRGAPCAYVSITELDDEMEVFE